MAVQLSVSLGSSFAEFALLDLARPRRALAHKRCYLPSEPLAPQLRQFLGENATSSPIRVHVSSRRLEKILDTRLGGSVAQIVTAGFENWSLLRQPTSHTHFDLTPTRGEPLASQDLIFGIQERMGPDGKVLQPLNMEELASISQRLKEKEIERVCINFLFANLNPKHQNQAADFFQKQGFLVFASTLNSRDEMLSWRKNILNASLYGTFQEAKDHIQSACEGLVDREQIYFLAGDGSLSVQPQQNLANTLFGLHQALANFYQDTHNSVLYLGLEKWFWLDPQARTSTWTSPWGLLAEDRPESQNLRTQPTQEIHLNELGDITVSDNELGYEPGPMVLGRAQRLTVMDVIARTCQLDYPWIQKSSQQKIEDAVKMMSRNSKMQQDLPPQEILNSLLDRCLQQVVLQSSLLSAQRPLIVTGVLAPHLIAKMKNLLGQTMELCPFASEVETLATHEVIAK